MSYTKTVWEDLPSTNTPLNATNLNNIENGIKDLQVTAVTTQNTDLDDYLEQGQYYFGADYIPTNIPAGVNGWLVVIPSGDESVPQVKQIWYRMGTPGSNDYETYERTRGGDSNWGPWRMISVDTRPTGEVNSAVGNGNLIIKRASYSADGTPNNGVVLEFGNSANWTGQLYIGDNSSQGIWYNGWSDGVRGTWQKLVTLDDVVTSGSNSNGKYIKYGDGTMICWNSAQVTKSVSNSWGSLYVCTAFSAGTFPQTFTSTPTVNIYCSGSSSVMLVTASGPSTTQVGNIQLARGDRNTSTTTTINYIAIGKWK